MVDSTILGKRYTMETRTERDTFGPIDVPAIRLWGAQTQRSLQNFAISSEQQPREIIRALAQVKRASASVNLGLGLLASQCAFHRWRAARAQ